jgi:hypothetical protein
MAWKLIQLDLFRTSAFIQKDNGENKKYFIEFINGYYFCFVQRKIKRKWSKPSIVDKSKNRLFLDYADNENGLKIEEVVY